MRGQSKISPERARAILRACGISEGDSFHALPSDNVDSLLAYADEHGYRKPRDANGSRGRYFHAMLQRLASREA